MREDNLRKVEFRLGDSSTRESSSSSSIQRKGLLTQLQSNLRLGRDHAHDLRGREDVFSSFFSTSKFPVRRRRITWLIITIFIVSFMSSQQVACNPLPKQGQIVSDSSSRRQGSPSFYYNEKSSNPPNGFISTGESKESNNNDESSNLRNGSSASALTSSSSSPPAEDQEQEQTLVKPSKMTFKFNSFCEADVSLERVTCRNLRRRSDLPKKQDNFNEVQQGIFVNISDHTDIRLEHIKQLFPNLIVLGITESPGIAPSLIGFGSRSSRASLLGLKEKMIPMSLLKDPNFAKRLGLIPGPTAAAAVSGNRGQRGVGQEDSTTKTKTTTTTSPTTSTRPWRDGLEDSHETNDVDVPLAEEVKKRPGENRRSQQDKMDVQMDAAVVAVGVKEMLPETPQKLKRFIWPSVRHLNISWNGLTSDALPDFLGEVFPNLDQIDLSNNQLTRLEKVEKMGWTKLQNIDVSGNLLDCMKLNLDWIEGGKIHLLHPNETVCGIPPHQINKPKPILKVIPLIRKMREECKELKNCTCDIDYIYEKDHVVHSMTYVNCSGRGFLDFPDPAHLPKPTSTLDLRRNKISSLATFVDNQEYMKLNVTNLFLDDNQISSINILEGSEWFYDFQMFSIRRNNLTEVPVYVLENVFRQNERLVQIDLSSNKFKCDCSTVSSFKVWLLKYASQIGNVEDVRCASTKEQIRFMRVEDWCKMDNGTELIDVLDMISIVLAILIVVVITKVYYDYWNYKKKGKLPWIVSKM